jgi:hypothetical protein
MAELKTKVGEFFNFEGDWSQIKEQLTNFE